MTDFTEPPDDELVPAPSELPETIKRLTRDLVKAAETLTAAEARFLVDGYYIGQENRKRSANQVRAMKKSKEPHEILSWLVTQNDTIEGQIKRALEIYTDTRAIGRWMKSLYGVGPCISAGIIAHIDINKAPTVGHIWNFAGLNPTVKWEKGKKRPWNADLKTLCWKIGTTFMKFSNHEECLYGNRLYRPRKILEFNRNVTGKNTELAISNQEKYDKKKEAWPWVAGCYKPEDWIALTQLAVETKTPMTIETIKTIRGEPGSGMPMLPPAQVDGRARRYATKIFLSHTHEVWWFLEHGELPPNPFALAILGHSDYIEPPNPPDGFLEARAARRRSEQGLA